MVVHSRLTVQIMICEVKKKQLYFLSQYYARICSESQHKSQNLPTGVLGLMLDCTSAPNEHTSTQFRTSVVLKVYGIQLYLSFN